jgi:hypothetical protein
LIKINQEKKGDCLVVHLSGSIEESVNFDQLIGPANQKIEVHCKEVLRINSIGVKSWIKYFQTYQAKGLAITFIECSSAIVEQLNLISNFNCGGTVESIYVPFCCTVCKTEFIGLFTTESIKKNNLQVSDQTCPKCSNKAAFDDIPDEYFGFLTR